MLSDTHSDETNKYPSEITTLTRRALRLDPKSMTFKILAAWFDMRTSSEEMLRSNPSEARILLYLLLSNLAFFLSWTMKAVIVPQQTGVNVFSFEVGLMFILAFVVRTGAMYLLGWGFYMIGSMFGGIASQKACRVALFWSALVAAPISVIAAILSVLFTFLELRFPIFGITWITTPPYWLGLIAFIWFFAVSFTVCQGFRKLSPIFLLMSCAALAALYGALYFRAIGFI